jgi:hypothetical protein
MRYFLSAAVGAATICGISMSIATAEPIHYAGGPLQEQGFCWTTTNGDQGFGFWTPCPPTVRVVHHKRK